MNQANRPDNPNAFLPRTLGIVHILFALLLTGVSLIWGIYFLGMPLLLEFAGQKSAAGLESTAERERAELVQLEQQIESTADGKAKDELIDRRLELQVNQEIPMEPPNFPLFGMNNPRVAGTIGLEIFTGLFFYFLMLIAGIGLVRIRRWGRLLARLVAVAKLAQVIVVGGMLAFIAAPTLAEGVRDQMATWQQARAEQADDQSDDAAPVNAPRMSPVEMGESVHRLILIHAVGTVVFGSIFPIITLLILNQESVRAVFDGTRKGLAQAEIS